MLARAYREYLLPLFRDFRLLSLFKHDQSVADSDVTPEYLVDHSWLVGSPRTVGQRLADMYGDSGGFGMMLVLTFDFSEEHEAWAASQQALINEVLPQFSAAA
jgi:alkanesulfonate monooxygenase SsuD/methylene tetrahydromethanopterin reductase-like flavin-dependent oxidoreductase (luciferase family)